MLYWMRVIFSADKIRVFMMFSKVYCLVYLGIISFKFIFCLIIIFSEVPMKNGRRFWKEKNCSGMESLSGIINKFNNWYGRSTYGVVAVTVGDDSFSLERKPI